MQNLQTKVLQLLTRTPTEGSDVNSLVYQEASFWQEAISEQLFLLWKQGKVFVSRVERQHFGYTPTKDAKWTLSRTEDYFGYSATHGVYQISSSAGKQISRLILLATLTLGSPIYSLAISPDGTEFVIGLYSGEIALGNLTYATIYKRIPAHSSRVWSLNFSPDGKTFISGSQDGQIILWDRYGDKSLTIASLEDWVTCTRFSPDGTHIISGHKLADPANPSVRVWTATPQQQVDSYFHHEKGNVYAVDYLPDGTGFVSGGSDKNVAYWSFEKQQLIFQFDKHKGTVTCLAVHPRFNHVVSGAWTGTLKVWALESGDVLQTVEAHNARVTSLAYSRSGNLLASGGKDSMIAVWSAPEVNLLTSVLAHEGWVRAIAFSDDSILVSGGSEGSCKIWKVMSLSDYAADVTQ